MQEKPKQYKSMPMCQSPGCSNLIIFTGKRGRPPSYCEKCRLTREEAPRERKVKDKSAVKPKSSHLADIEASIIDSPNARRRTRKGASSAISLLNPLLTHPTAFQGNASDYDQTDFKGILDSISEIRDTQLENVDWGAFSKLASQQYLYFQSQIAPCRKAHANMSYYPIKVPPIHPDMTAQAYYDEPLMTENYERLGSLSSDFVSSYAPVADPRHQTEKMKKRDDDDGSEVTIHHDESPNHAYFQSPNPVCSVSDSVLYYNERLASVRVSLNTPRVRMSLQKMGLDY